MADIPMAPLPPLHPGTKEPVGPDALAPAVDTLGPAFDRMKDRLANARRRGGLE